MSSTIKVVIYFLLVLIPCLIWPFLEVNVQQAFQMVVPKYTEVDLFETSRYYFWILVFTAVPVLLLSFDKKVAFYKTWKTLFPAIIFIGIGFIFWDVLFTEWNVWGFNETYFLGATFFGLPIEELFFFLNVPFACFFIHECLLSYFPKDNLKSLDSIISIGLGLLLVFIGIMNLDRIYTSSAFLMTGTALVAHFLLFDNNYRTYFYRTFLLVLIPFLIVNGALTGGFTKTPVVLYNPEEFLGLRIISVPIEDAIYGLLLLLLIVTFQSLLNGLKTGKKEEILPTR